MRLRRSCPGRAGTATRRPAPRCRPQRGSLGSPAHNAITYPCRVVLQASAWAARRSFNSSAPAQLLLNSCVTSAACKPCTSRTRHADAASRPAIARLTVALAQQPGLKPASEATAGCVGHFKRRGTDTVWLGPAARRPCRGARATVTAGIEQTGMAKLPDVGQQAGQEAPTPPSGVSSPSCFRVLLLAQVLTINTVPHLSVSPRTVTAHRASQNV